VFDLNILRKAIDRTKRRAGGKFTGATVFWISRLVLALVYRLLYILCFFAVADQLAIPQAIPRPLDLLTVTVTGDGSAEFMVAVRYLGSCKRKGS